MSPTVRGWTLVQALAGQRKENAKPPCGRPSERFDCASGDAGVNLTPHSREDRALAYCRCGQPGHDRPSPSRSPWFASTTDHAFRRLVQFTHVAAPLVGREQLHHFRTGPAEVLLRLARIQTEEMPRQSRDVLAQVLADQPEVVERGDQSVGIAEHTVGLQRVAAAAAILPLPDERTREAGRDARGLTRVAEQAGHGARLPRGGDRGLLFASGRVRHSNPRVTLPGWASQ